MKTYDIHFNDSQSSNSKGFKLSKQHAISYAKSHVWQDYLRMYAGGVVTVVCNEDGETVFTLSIPAKQYKVYKVGRKSGRRVTIERNLTESEAQRVVSRYPSSTRSMVCYTAQ